MSPPLWTPSAERQARSNIGKWCSGHGFGSYQEAWEWSVSPQTMGEFWADMAERAGVRWHARPGAALVADPGRPSGYRWFPGGRLNYAERALTPPAGPGPVALVAVSQARGAVEMTWEELGDLVARARTGLVTAGVSPGDRVAAYMPNIPETLALMLACASIGAIWASCPPEMGVTGALDRLAQLSPVLFVSVDGYRYGRHVVGRAAEAGAVRAGLPSVRKAVWLPYLDQDGGPPPGWCHWRELVAEKSPLEFAAVDFDHPLYVLFSSGTTGKPKPIVHGHGGILLEHAKALSLHFDLGPGDRFFWYSTTGWMMWNFCVSGLLTGSTVVLYDGDPGGGTGQEGQGLSPAERPAGLGARAVLPAGTGAAAGGLWRLISSTRTTCAGVSAAYMVSSMKSGARPGADHDLSALRTLGVTGSPLPEAAAAWAYRCVGAELMLESFSGGTDVCTGFLGSSPLHPVWAGEISCRCLGARAEVFDDEGRSLVGQEGELVLSAPLPSMPVGFWGDGDGSRYRAAYFGRWPGTWAHGDRARLTERGTVVVTGRSDGTLNRGGVRMGTAEFYAVVEALPGVADSLVVHLDDPAGGPGEVWLFLVAEDAGGDEDAGGAEDAEDAGGAEGSRGAEDAGGDQDDLARRACAALRRELSPRHVPDRVLRVPAVPRTLSGKKLEVPVKRLLGGAPAGEVLALTSVSAPESLEPFIRLAMQRAAGEQPSTEADRRSQ